MWVLAAAVASLLLGAVIFLNVRSLQAQQEWTRLVAVETRAVAALDELVRAQNGFHQRLTAGAEHPQRYRLVAQLLDDEALQSIDIAKLRGRVRAFRTVVEDPAPRATDIDATSRAVVFEACRIIDERKAEIARQLPALETQTQWNVRAGVGVAWVAVLLALVAFRMLLDKVVKPVEQISAAARRIADGDLSARAQIAGDREIADLAGAINHMAEKLKAHARTDELTALPNFRAFRERIDAELQRAERYPERVGILVLDLDHFKKYNDTYGHAAGNDALQRVAQAIRETVRTADYPARYGGEEFAVIAPQVEASSLVMVAERIRANIEALPAPPDGTRVTVSIGAAIYPDDARDREALFQVADARLYEAKKAGRNRVVGPAAEGRRLKAEG